jgi:hypothetical protein
LGASLQTPLLKQGFEAHSSMGMLQRVPDQPFWQLHEKEFKASLQTPLLKQGLEAHSLMLV